MVQTKFKSWKSPSFCDSEVFLFGSLLQDWNGQLAKLMATDSNQGAFLTPMCEK